MAPALAYLAVFYAAAAEHPVEARAVCAAPRSAPLVRFELAIAPWRSWPALCERLAHAVVPAPPPFDSAAAERASERLRATGYFATARCEPSGDGAELRCTMTPQQMVKEVELDGDIPFALIEADLERRVFLRPGALVRGEDDLSRQRERLQQYLEDEGYFGSTVRIEPSLVSGAEPNQGVRLDVRIDAGPSYPLGVVSIRGDAVIETEEARDELEHHWLPFVPMRFRPMHFSNDLDELEQTIRRRGWPRASVRGHYAVDEEAGRVDAYLTIDSGPRLRLTFIGNTAIDDGDLEELAPFGEEGIIDATAVDTMRRRITTLYQRRGHYAVEVTSELREPAPGVRDITFRVNEGPRAEVVMMRWHGNVTFDADTLREATEMLSDDTGVTTAARWVQEWAERDVAALRRHYRDQGFPAAKLAMTYTRLGDDELVIDVWIDEGPRRVVESFALRGLPETLDERRLRRRLSLVQGQPYVEENAEADERLLLALLAANGYPRASLVQHIDAPPAETGGAVAVSYDVDAGERAVFGGFLVRGNFRTRRVVIDRVLELDAGVPLDVVAIGTATARLRALGIFSSVQLTPIDEIGTGDTWLLAALEEREVKSLDLVASFATDDDFSVGADYGDRNLFGRAVDFSVELRLSNASELLAGFIPRIGNTDQLIARLRAPRPFGAPFDLGLSGFYSYQDKALFEERRTGGAVALVRTLLERSACRHCPDLLGSLQYELGSNETFRPIPEGANTIARVFPRLRADRTDSLVDPQKGFTVDTRLELAQPLFAFGLPEARRFWRYLGAGSAYVILGTPFAKRTRGDLIVGGRVVLATSAQYGAGGPLGDDPALPESEAFFYGGDTSVRGLQERASLAGEPNAHYLFTGSLELRWYLLRNLGFGTLQVAGFTDYGTVSRDLDDLFADFTVTAGPVLRYVTPVGPISLAYGWPIVRADSLVRAEEAAPDEPAPAPSGGRLHFSFGYHF